MSKQTIKITNTFAELLASITAAGKTPWVIITADYAVGAYTGREAARAAKAAENLEGKIVKAEEIDFVLIELVPERRVIHSHQRSADTAPADAIIEVLPSTAPATAIPVAPIGSDFEGDPHSYLCPHCGIHLENGVGNHLMEVNGKLVKHTAYEYECLACGGEFGPAISGKKPAKQSKAIPHTSASSAERPCKLVWHIADRLHAANPACKRRDVVAECVREGVAYFTARTQYQQWLSVQKEMAAREKANEKVKKS